MGWLVQHGGWGGGWAGVSSSQWPSHWCDTYRSYGPVETGTDNGILMVYLEVWRCICQLSPVFTMMMQIVSVKLGPQPQRCPQIVPSQLPGSHVQTIFAQRFALSPSVRREIIIMHAVTSLVLSLCNRTDVYRVANATGKKPELPPLSFATTSASVTRNPLQ
jgi:hypothetical protein